MRDENPLPLIHRHSRDWDGNACPHIILCSGKHWSYRCAKLATVIVKAPEGANVAILAGLTLR